MHQASSQMKVFPNETKLKNTQDNGVIADT